MTSGRVRRKTSVVAAHLSRAALALYGRTAVDAGERCGGPRTPAQPGADLFADGAVPLAGR